MDFSILNILMFELIVFVSCDLLLLAFFFCLHDDDDDDDDDDNDDEFLTAFSPSICFLIKYFFSSS